MMPITIITGAMAAGFIAIHLLVNRLRFLEAEPRSAWLSFAGGVSVAWVFLHVLPEIALHQGEFAEAFAVMPIVAESAVYGLALAGMAAFYGLERLVQDSQSANREAGLAAHMGQGAMYLHLALFGLLNLLIGYLLNHREDDSLWALGLYFVALSLHLLTADFGMRQDHPESYDRIGRWAMAACTAVGWLLGVSVMLSEALVGCLFAFLAGAIVLTVFKEELPEERKSRFLPFLGGAVLYTFLVLAERHWA